MTQRRFRLSRYVYSTQNIGVGVSVEVSSTVLFSLDK